MAIAVLLAASGCGSPNSTTSPTPSAPFTKIDLLLGSGMTATDGRTLTVAYTGWLYDESKAGGKGTQFETGTFTFVLGAGKVIAGWDQGIGGMNVGGQRRLTIPPELAYRDKPQGSAIPANATLVFDITLLAVQ